MYTNSLKMYIAKFKNVWEKFKNVFYIISKYIFYTKICKSQFLYLYLDNINKLIIHKNLQ